MSARRMWYVLCIRRKVWWGENSQGYSDSILAAGHYTDEEALGIVERMNCGGDSPVKLVPANARDEALRPVVVPR